MRIVIVGAGIAGLTLAVALRRSGNDLVILEQTRHPRRPGAGTQIPPHITRYLTRMGLGKALGRSGVRPLSRDILDWQDGTLLESTPIGQQDQTRLDAPCYTLLRSDLRAALLSEVADGTVLTGHYVTDVLEASDAIALRCANGREFHGDVVIGADGSHSTVRPALGPEEHRFSGLSVCRGLISAAQFPSSNNPPRIRMWTGPNRQFVCYPVDGGRMISFNAILPSEHTRPEAWGTRERIGDLCAAFAGWNEEVLTLITASEWIGLWTLYENAPALEWNRDRIALMGDAAHPMMPFFFQGATQSIEDAMVLAHFLSRATRRTVEESLEKYAKARKSRVEQVQGTFLLLLTLLHQAGDTGIADSAFLLEQEKIETDLMRGYYAPDADVSAP